MLILILALAAAPQLQTVALAPAATSWFQPQPKSFGSSFRMAVSEKPQAAIAESSGSIDCKIRVLKPDPNFDAKIVGKTPADLDPKIVRPSPCRK